MLTRPEHNHGSAPLLKPRPHAVVIGSGFGGLAAAVRLGARGYRVTVLERLDGPGGRAYVFRQDGFTFDGGPTIITAPFLLEELWKLCGRKLEDDIHLRPLSPFYSIRFHDGETLTCCADQEEMRREVQRISPNDVEGYERFMAKSKEIYQIGFEELGHVPFNSWTDMARLLPQLFRLKSYKTIYSLAAHYVKNDRLRFFLSFHPLFVGGNPFNVTSIYGLIAFLERRYGVHFAMGGTGSIVNGLVKLIQSQGGTIRLGADVEEITLKGQRATGVRLSNGESIKADVVVSNADVAWTYRNLLPKSARRHWTDRRIDKARYSMSLFVWYFGTNRTYPDVPHHTILLGPRYKELLQDIFEKKYLAQDFSLYLHRPTATDPSLAPQGSDAFYVLSPVPHLDGKTDWRVEAEPYRARIAQYLSSTVLPQFEDHISTSRIITPLHFQDKLMSYKGAAFSFEPVLTQSAWFRPHNQSEDIDRLYLVGAGTHPGAGVPGVLSSARVLDRIIPHASVLV